MPTDSASQALEILRNPSTFQWYVIPLFALVVYVYTVEVERRNWSLVFAGLAFWERPGLSLHQLRPYLGSARSDRLFNPDWLEHRNLLHVRHCWDRFLQNAASR